MWIWFIYLAPSGYGPNLTENVFYVRDIRIMSDRTIRCARATFLRFRSVCSDCVDRSGRNAVLLWDFGNVVEFSIPTAPTSFLSDSTELTKSTRQQEAALRTEVRRRLSISSRHGWHVDAHSFAYLQSLTSRARRHPKDIGTCAESVCRVFE